MKQIILSWIWYILQLLFWIGVMAFCAYGFYLLMTDTTHSKEQMQGNAGGAIMAIFIFLASAIAWLQTFFTARPKRS